MYMYMYIFILYLFSILAWYWGPDLTTHTPLQKIGLIANINGSPKSNVAASVSLQLSHIPFK